MPGIIYKFENENLIIFEDNFKYLDDLLFVAYFDSETNKGSGSRDYLEDEEMYPVSYCLIFAFHPKLDIKRIVIFRSFQNTLDELNDIIYLKSEVIDKRDPITVNQLKASPEKV